MIQNVLRAIGGIGIYDTVTVCLFVLVFMGVLLWAARLKKPFLNAMSSLPLDDDQPLSKREKREDSHE